MILDPYRASADPFFGDVVFLMHADGADGSSTFADVSASAHACTALNGITVSTANPKFGTGTVLSEGSGGKAVSATSSADLNMGSGDFTVECWAYLSATSGLSRGIIGKGANMYATTMEFYIFCEDSAIRARISDGSSYTTLITTTVFAAIDAYIHIALVRSGNTLTLYANGVEHNSAAFTGSIPASADPLYIAGNPSENGIIGGIDEIRITKGVARYSGATYTVPTTAFPDS